MAKLAANLSMMYTEVDFLDRFQAAAASGFTGVEYLFPYDFPAEAVAERLKGAGLQQALFNLPPGNWDKGERGLAALKGREADFDAALEKALAYAKALDCPRVHAMSGLIAHGADHATYVANLKRGADRAAEAGVTICLEPINHRDVPGYFLNTTQQALDVMAEVDKPNVRLQLDLYHLQITEGDITMRTREVIGAVEHVQIAGNPDRNEPDIGEVHYPYMLTLLDQIGFDGWVGCEYRPKGRTQDGLGWAAPWGVRPG